MIPGLGRYLLEGNGNPLQDSCLENSTERSLEGYSTWDHKESDTTKQITHTLTYASNKTGSVFITSEFLKILALDIKKSNTN